MNSNNLSRFAPVVLRIALCGVFFWFGISQLTQPVMWTSLVPSWATNFGLSANTIVHLNGVFEVLAAALLIVGIWVRPVATLLALHLIVIASHFGFGSAIGIRDFGLSFSTFAVALFGPDQYSYSYKSPTGGSAQ